MQVITPDGWTMRALSGDAPADIASRQLPAAVPGCVHLDLLAAGEIPDPFLDDNESVLAWIGQVDWSYSCEFEWAPGSDRVHELVAEGLDTFATIEINGVEIARTRNMHRTYRFDIGPLLREGTNTLSVTFEAGLPATLRASEEIGPLPHVNKHPFNAARKMACNYGWDWGPDLITAGIWRSLRIESWSGARIASVRPLVDVAGDDGVLDAHVEIVREPGVAGPLSVAVEVDGRVSGVEVPDEGGVLSVRLTVPAVRRWWPRGYGDQPLYAVRVGLLSGETEVATWDGRVGFRTVALDTAPDGHGVPFRIVVNDAAIFVRGVNWIPDDAFPSRITPERYAERLAQARDAHANLIRVWGGGIYESESFYDFCDEQGLLVWQDFLFACAAYSEEEPLRSEVEAEARDAVTRLSPHPSLVLWNGCNENIWGYEDWDWKDPIGDRGWGWGYYNDLLPAVVRELDPSRTYSPGSPYSFTPGLHPNDPTDGLLHIWDVWNERDYTVYRDYVPRFVAEFGFQGPPTWSTMVGAIHDDPLEPESPGMLVHQKAEDGQGKLMRGLEPHLPTPVGLEDWHWATSLNQARAIRFGIEHFRSWGPICSGTVVWQLNDCWPVTSWAAVDGNGRLKPLWFALRAAFEDRLLTVQPRGDGLALVVVNDCAEQWQGVAQISRCRFDGTSLATAGIAYDVPARGVATLSLPADVAMPSDPAREVLRVSSGTTRAWWHFAEDVDSDLPDPDLGVAVLDASDGYRVTVTARSYVRDLALLVDRIDPDAVVSDMLATLLPGDQIVLDVRSSARPTVEDLLDPWVLRSSNQLVAAARRTDGT